MGGLSLSICPSLLKCFFFLAQNSFNLSLKNLFQETLSPEAPLVSLKLFLGQDPDLRAFFIISLEPKILRLGLHGLSAATEQTRLPGWVSGGVMLVAALPGSHYVTR